jgi:hypothetical protein
MRQSRQASIVAKKRKQDASTYASTHSEKSELQDLKPPSRASTFPHARSKSKDVKMGEPGNPSRLDTLNYPPQSTAQYYDTLHHSNADGATASPSLTSGISHNQESFPASPADQKDQSFPLADISAVMFPSSDPVEYPNQSVVPAGHSYDDILKNLAADPTFPFPTSLDELRMHRAAGAGAFVPPSSTFMFNNAGESQDQNNNFDTDMQLLGPMPAYMMHGGGFNSQSGNNSGNNGGMNTPTDFTSQFLNQSGNQMFVQAGQQNPVNTVDLDQLLNGEEWSNPNQNSGYGAILQNNNAFGTNQNANSNFQQRATSNPQSVVSDRGNSARTSADMHEGNQFGTKNVSFDDLNPGILGWNLGGY